MPRAAGARKPGPFKYTPQMRIVILHGKEPYLMRERTGEIIKALGDACGEVDVFTFDGAETDVATVLDEVRSYGLMQHHKLVVVDQADEFLKVDGRRPIMERYAASPVDTATLLLRAETWHPGKLDKAVARCGLVYPIRAAEAAEAPGWCVRRCARRHGATLDPDAADRLVRLVGPDLARLDMEITKLATYVGPGGTIRAAEVAQIVGQSREEQAWSLQQPLARGDAAGALGTLHDLIRQAKRPDDALPLITWAICDLLRKVHAARRLMDRGTPAGTLSGRLRLFGESRDAILNAARRLPPETTAPLLQYALRTDLRNKSGLCDPLRSIEVLAMDVADTMAG